MRPNKFALTIILLSLNLFFVIGQIDKEKIEKRFDKIEYYPNLTIKTAYSMKYFKYNGFAIEFDTLGNPTAIGKYWKGKKFSWWIKPDNSKDYYFYGGYTDDIVVPTCSTGSPYDFQQLYNSLLFDERTARRKQ